MDQGQEQQLGLQNKESSEATLIEKLSSSLNLACSMPPSKLRKNLIGLINLAPEIEDNLLEKIDLPMEIDKSDPTQPFLKTQFNRDGDSYRSPYTNQFLPQCESGYKPEGAIRNFQESGNLLFAEYTKLYYGGQVFSNFYVLENEEGGKNFSCGFFAKKFCDDEGFNGSWDSFNIVDIVCEGEQATYKLTTTILTQMNLSNKGINLTGYLKRTKQQKRKLKVEEQVYSQHIITIGELIQDLQTIMRQQIEDIYIAKTQQVIFTTRYQYTREMQEHKNKLAKDLKNIKFG